MTISSVQILKYMQESKGTNFAKGQIAKALGSTVKEISPILDAMERTGKVRTFISGKNRYWALPKKTEPEKLTPMQTKPLVGYDLMSFARLVEDTRGGKLAL